MPLCGVSPKLPYCVVITSIFLKIWNGRESHQDIKAFSKRHTASIVLFQDFPRGTIMYCNYLARIDSSIKPRHLIQMIVPSEASWLFCKFAYLCLHCLKCSYVIPGKKAFSCKNAYTLFAHPVLCSDFTPRVLKKFTFCVITA